MDKKELLKSLQERIEYLEKLRWKKILQLADL
jgi:hypothetical protein